jgi:hypothetical protein
MILAWPEAGKTYKALAKNKLDGKHMAGAAVDGNVLIF